MFIFTIIRSVRKGFRAYGKENVFTRFVDRFENELVKSIETDDIESLKLKIRISLFVYTGINLFIYGTLKDYLGSSVIFHGFMLSSLFMVSLLGFLAKSSFDRLKEDLMRGFRKYTKWLFEVELFVLISYYLVHRWFLQEYGEPLDPNYKYIAYLMAGVLGNYLLYLTFCAIVRCGSYLNYKSGNFIVISLKCFLAHCKKYKKEDPLQIMTFWTDTCLSIVSFIWIFVKSTAF